MKKENVTIQQPPKKTNKINILFKRFKNTFIWLTVIFISLTISDVARLLYT